MEWLIIPIWLALAIGLIWLWIWTLIDCIKNEPTNGGQ